MTTKHEPQVGDVTPFILALEQVKAERDALLAALQDAVWQLEVWGKVPSQVAAARAAIARATGGGA